MKRLLIASTIAVTLLVAAACTPTTPADPTTTTTTATSTTSTTSTTVPDTPPVLESVAVATGRLHTCALVGDGTARCWGDNSAGQLGNGTIGGSSSVPGTVTGLTDASDITVGDNQSCALLGDGTARCWGDNTAGQLGNGTTTRSSVPVTVSG